MVTNNPLTNAGTTLTSTTLTALPAVDATQHAVIVLDPIGAGNGPEIVYVTAHTAASTGATIVRGREGTAGVQHSSTMTWVHGPVASDWITMCTSATRPSGTGLPYQGQRIYETDTDKEYAYSGSAWVEVGRLGAWTAHTPTLAADGGSPLLGNGVVSAAYRSDGKTCHYRGSLVLGTTTAFGTGNLYWSLPINAAAFGSAAQEVIGSGAAVDVSAGLNYTATPIVVAGNATRIAFACDAAGGLSGGSSIPLPWTTGDYLNFSLTYETV